MSPSSHPNPAQPVAERKPALWVALHFPHLALEAFIPRWEWQQHDQGSVILQQQRVLAMSPAARTAGVRTGMRRGGVQMLLPDASFFPCDSRKQQDLLQAAALALLQYTPSVALHGAAGIVLEVSSSLRLFGGIRRLRQRIRMTVQALGLSVSLACAPFSKAAALLALYAAERARAACYCLSPRKLATVMDQLPVHTLSQAQAYLDLLEGLACHQLKDLQKLPRAGLQRRCGAALLQELDQAYGKETALHLWVVASETFHIKRELAGRLERSDQLLPYVQALLTQLCSWLRLQQLALSQLRLCLHHERGRSAIAPSQLNIMLAEPGWQEAHLQLLLRERLQQLGLSGPVIALELEATETASRQLHSEDLFPEPGGKPEDHQRLLSLLVARLGEHQVLQAAPQADFRPDIANQWVSVLHKKSAQAHVAASAAHALLRPVWLLAQPLALTLRQHQPWYAGSVLTIISPAERIEAGWWSDSTQVRDYFIASHARHQLYWIYRERNVTQTDGDAIALSWFLHGIFG
ncbi:MAG: Y-family DNA polymerase [Undibacterium curvum]|uniref:Y-family DNA polymerase n=1 Tax=Undibacterium curvum TaxID=2762294 RepID=UPI003BDC7C51